MNTDALVIETVADAEKLILTAVEALCRLQGDRAAIVTDAVLIYAAQAFDADGDQSTMVAHAYPTGQQAHYKTLGLLDFVRAEIRESIFTGDDD